GRSRFSPLRGTLGTYGYRNLYFGAARSLSPWDEELASAGPVIALDVFVFLLLIGGAAVGFVRGFVHEVISLFAWIVAIAMLKLFHTQLWSGLRSSFDTSPAAAAVLAFAILFVPSFVIVKLLARSLGGRTRKSPVLGPVDRMLGG